MVIQVLAVSRKTLAEMIRGRDQDTATPMNLDTDQITTWRSIVTLIVFILTSEHHLSTRPHLF
jgi:hypothetical protein